MLDDMCSCKTENYNIKDNKCACNDGLMLLPIESDCVANLDYSTNNGTKFSCKPGLTFLENERKLIGTWDQHTAVCNE